MLPPIVPAWLAGFAEISLEETNRRAQMLQRIDNKYILSKPTLLQVLASLKNQYCVLTIDQHRLFTYRSCYFDDGGRCYREHHQGKRQRFKVRTRLYADSGDIFFEIKMKGKRGQTDKMRERCDEFITPMITAEQFDMVRALYEDYYRKPFGYQLRPALIVNYKRATLVSMKGGERITIDTDIHFETLDGKRGELGAESVIVETKSASGRSTANQALKAHRVRKQGGCSKYCLGLILVGEAQKYNNFRNVIKILEKQNKKITAAPLKNKQISYA
jgi:hypothetical protein